MNPSYCKWTVELAKVFSKFLVKQLLICELIFCQLASTVMLTKLSFVNSQLGDLVVMAVTAVRANLMESLNCKL